MRRRLRWRATSVRRGLLLIFSGFVVFCLAGLLIGVADGRQERLERIGIRATGTVVRTSHPLRGPDSALVDYAFQGREYRLKIDGSEYYDVGDVVMVFVDPDNPGSATLPNEQPQSAPAYWLTMFLMVGAFALAIVGARDLWLVWRGRLS